MFLARVVGTSWSTKKVENLANHRFLQVQILDIALKATGTVKTAVDVLGAGIGETVICVGGSASRRWLGSNDTSFDTAVIAIVDLVELEEVGPASFS